jgi:hypothetical protein
VAFLVTTGSLANSRVPLEQKGDGFGAAYSELFDNTIVYARVGWVDFYYRYSGREPAQPAPGWVRLAIEYTRDEWKADRLVFAVGEGESIEAVGYPYFAITLEQARRIAAAPRAELIATRTRTARNPQQVWKLALSDRQRELLGKLASHGDKWEAPQRPWEIGGAVAFVIDRRPPTAPHLERLKALLTAEVERRERTRDSFIFVVPGDRGADRSPAVRGTNHYEPGSRWYNPAEPREFLERLKPLPGGGKELFGDLASVVAMQQVQSMVLFVGDGPPLADPEVVEAKLRQECSRLFVVWIGDPASQSARAQQLRELASKTRGGFVGIDGKKEK